MSYQLVLSFFFKCNSSFDCSHVIFYVKCFIIKTVLSLIRPFDKFLYLFNVCHFIRIFSLLLKQGCVFMSMVLSFVRHVLGFVVKLTRLASFFCLS